MNKEYLLKYRDCINKLHKMSIHSGTEPEFLMATSKLLTSIAYANDAMSGKEHAIETLMCTMKLYYADLSGKPDKIEEANKNLDDLNQKILRDILKK